MSHRFTFLGLTCSVLAATGALIGCGHPAEQADSSRQPVVRVTKPLEREVTLYEYFTGRTDAVEMLEVRARVTGYLQEIKFKAGQDVKAGDVLFKIDPRPYQAELDRANGQVLLAEATLKLAIADYARAKATARTPGAISYQDIDKYAAAQGQADAALKAAKAQAEGSKLNLDFTDVTSPIAGIIGRNLLTLGNLVTQDQTLLTTIVSQDPMYAYFDVDERTMLRVQGLIREGKLKSVRAGGIFPVDFGLANEGDRYPHEGTIDFVNNQVDTSTGTIQIRAVLPNKLLAGGMRLLTPGLFVRVRVPVGPPHKALLVPEAAIGTDQGKKFLLVVNDQNGVEYRPVNLGPQQPGGLQAIEPIKVVRTDQGLREAQEGEQGEDSLKLGDQVIVTGLQRVRAGATVEPRPYEPGAAAK